MPNNKIIALVFLLCFTAEAFAGTVELPRTGQVTCYDSSGNTISCSGSGQDGATQAGSAWPAPRFTDNGNGTITDQLTGLMWMKDSNCFSFQAWEASFTKLADFNTNPGSYSCSGYTASYSDWRLANINELESLVNGEEASTGTWLNAQGFYWVPLANFWTSTSDAGGSSAWRVNMHDGVAFNADKTGANYMWPVRTADSSVNRIWRTGQVGSHTVGDDGHLRNGVTWPDPRFTNNGDGTVTDNLTGLVWLKDAGCFTGTWANALSTVSAFNANSGTYSCAGYTATYSDWRLPNRKELRSLLDRSRSNPILPSGNPFSNAQSNYYWTSTTYAVKKNYAWEIDFWSGRENEGSKTLTRSIWPVRAGQVSASVNTAIPVLSEGGMLLLFFLLGFCAILRTTCRATKNISNRP